MPLRNVIREVKKRVHIQNKSQFFGIFRMNYELNFAMKSVMSMKKTTFSTHFSTLIWDEKSFNNKAKGLVKNLEKYIFYAVLVKKYKLQKDFQSIHLYTDALKSGNNEAFSKGFWN